MVGSCPGVPLGLFAKSPGFPPVISLPVKVKLAGCTPIVTDIEARLWQPEAHSWLVGHSRRFQPWFDL